MIRGLAFEQRVLKLLEGELAAGSLGIAPSSSQIFHRKSYYSAARGSKIIFDISIEVLRPGATAPFLLWLWECKEYRHSVPVDDVEEFHAKLQQIGGVRAKGTMITSAKFQRGALNYAASHGIGLVRIVPSGAISHVMECRSPGTAEEQREEVRRGLVAGLAASRDCEVYCCSSTGVFSADLEDYFRKEMTTDILRAGT